jgi:hypothetical protein
VGVAPGRPAELQAEADAAGDDMDGSRSLAAVVVRSGKRIEAKSAKGKPKDEATADERSVFPPLHHVDDRPKSVDEPIVDNVEPAERAAEDQRLAGRDRLIDSLGHAGG